MAVLLCRGDGKAITTSSDQRNAPRVIIKSEPVSTTASYQGKKITARSAQHYACAEPCREDVWRENFDRRKVQLTACGFHGVAHQPYRDVGPVVLDDRTLILDGLGQQATNNVTSPSTDTHLQSEDHPSSQNHLSLPPVPLPLGRVQLRAKTPSQFPTELASLPVQLREVEERGDLVRRGHGLFTLIRDKEKEKQAVEQYQASQDMETRRNEWTEAYIVADNSLHDNGWQSTIQENTTSPATRKKSCVWSGDLAAENQHGEEGGGGREEEEEGKEEEEEEEEEGRETRGEEHHHVSVVEMWYRQLCVLVWVLESMRMDSPAHMTPLRQCWRIDRPPPNEAVGRRRAERDRALLQQWETVKQQAKKPHSKLSPGRLTRQHTSLLVPQDHKTSHDPQSRGHMTSHDPKEKQQSTAARGVRSGGIKGLPSLEEEQKIRRQRKLTPSQMDGLLTLLEEELNYSKKQSRSQIRALLADQAWMQRDVGPVSVGSHPPVSLDVADVSRKFSEATERREMIVHEQLTAMERDQHKALQQRFTSLSVSGHLWHDLAVMREGVEIETTAMARRRLLMNYDWYSELLSLLPPEVKDHRYCQELLTTLQELARYMCHVGPRRMSKRRLMQVLGTLRPWELRSPDISAAVEFLRKHVIYIVAEDYEKWLNWHTLSQHTRTH